MPLNTHKLDDLILYLGKSPHVGNLGVTKLWKLIYFIDVSFLRETGMSLTGSDYIKYDHGPVPSHGQKRLDLLGKHGRVQVKAEDHGSYRQNHVLTVEEESPAFSEEEHSLIDAVCRRYGRKTASYLSELSHDEPAWFHAEKLQKLSPMLMCYGSQEDEEGL
jgi:uncharacterized phage-associated protein